MKDYLKKAAEILTKVFNASRLETEVTEDMVKLLIDEREKEKARSGVILANIKRYLLESGYECDRKAILDSSESKEVIISGRIKTIVSAMYNLLATKNGHHQDINDMIGIMLICEDKQTCYDLFELLLEKMKANNATIISVKDMIANPKKNGYQSIHVHVEDKTGIVFELQIKSYKMFAFSQTGDCKHELYKKKLETSMLKEDEWIIFDSLREEHWI